MELTSNIRCLGVEIQDDLKWTTHVDREAVKANRKLLFLCLNLKEIP